MDRKCGLRLWDSSKLPSEKGVEDYAVGKYQLLSACAFRNLYFGIKHIACKGQFKL